jgi:hypothetical protein
MAVWGRDSPLLGLGGARFSLETGTLVSIYSRRRTLFMLMFASECVKMV